MKNYILVEFTSEEEESNERFGRRFICNIFIHFNGPGPIAFVASKFEEWINNFWLQDTLANENIEEIVANNKWSLEELKKLIINL